MNYKETFFKNFVRFTVLSVLCVLLYISGIGIALGQKKPISLKLDVDGDDLQLCGGQGKGDIGRSQFCVLFRDYYSSLNAGNIEAAQIDRNEMIEIVRGQVDTFYKQRKDGRSAKIRIFQTILDFLQIGGDLAVTIMNGERAKTIVGAALSGLDSGNKAFDKNFQVLQTQVLINKMNANRAEILTEILTKKPQEVSQYSWYGAKNDLRRYLFAGTFDNALDTLVNESGADVSRAERVLRIVEARPIVTAANKNDEDAARKARPVKDAFEEALASGDDTKIKAATEKLQKIVDELDEDSDLNDLFTTEGISKTTADGQKIYDALDLIIDELPETKGRKGRDLVIKINQAFIKNPLN